MKTLIIYEGDDTKQVVDKFVKDNRLETEKGNKLTKIVDEHMKTILQKIPEEIDDV